MKKMLFIINPISGVGKQKTIEKLVGQHLDKTQFEYRFTYTKAAKHAIELSNEAATKGINVVVAVGGDGSVNEVGQSLIGTETALGIIPTGSGNGLARHLNLPMNLPKAVQVLNNFSTTKIDTCILNNQVFLGTAGIGFDAHIAHRFAQFGPRGFVSYIRLVLKEYMNFAEQGFKLVIDGKEFTKKALFVAFANSAQYGNNASIAPHADIQDGLVDICIARKIPLANAFGHIRMLFTKNFGKSPYVEILQGREITVTQQAGIAHLDGEPVEVGEKLEVKVKPESLKVMVNG